jgi:hypothetical protein
LKRLGEPRWPPRIGVLSIALSIFDSKLFFQNTLLTQHACEVPLAIPDRPDWRSKNPCNECVALCVDIIAQQAEMKAASSDAKPVSGGLSWSGSDATGWTARSSETDLCYKVIRTKAARQQVERNNL